MTDDETPDRPFNRQSALEDFSSEGGGNGSTSPSGNDPLSKYAAQFPYEPDEQAQRAIDLLKTIGTASWGEYEDAEIVGDVIGRRLEYTVRVDKSVVSVETLETGVVDDIIIEGPLGLAAVTLMEDADWCGVPTKISTDVPLAECSLDTYVTLTAERFYYEGMPSADRYEELFDWEVISSIKGVDPETNEQGDNLIALNEVEDHGREWVSAWSEHD